MKGWRLQQAGVTTITASAAAELLPAAGKLYRCIHCITLRVPQPLQGTPVPRNAIRVLVAGCW